MVKIITAQRNTVGAMLSKNATVLPLGEYRGGARRTLYFTRPELNQLLGLYSRNVIRGVWRDYAIDHRDGQALFSIFRHTHESALYTIVKSAGSGGEEQFTVLKSRQRGRVAPQRRGGILPGEERPPARPDRAQPARGARLFPLEAGARLGRRGLTRSPSSRP